MNKIIERNFDSDVLFKLSVISFISLSILVGIFNIEMSETTIVIQSVLFVIISISVLLMFIYKGFSIEDEKIYKAYFLFGLRIKKMQIEIYSNNIITILNFSKKNRYNLSTVWERDLSYKTPTFDLYLVDENHRNKIEVMSLKGEKQANMAIEFLTANSALTYQKYSPV